MIPSRRQVLSHIVVEPTFDTVAVHRDLDKTRAMIFPDHILETVITTQPS